VKGILERAAPLSTYFRKYDEITVDQRMYSIHLLVFSFFGAVATGKKQPGDDVADGEKSYRRLTGSFDFF
jgi:hypothetical protein